MDAHALAAAVPAPPLPATRTWVHFAAGPGAAVPTAPGGADVRLDRYVVTEVRAVRGPDTLAVAPGWQVLRAESAAPVVPGAPTPVALAGVTHHVLYTDAAQRAELRQVSTLARHPVAVLIPIAKAAAWWDLAADERARHFRPSADAEGHTAIGLAYAARIARKLYHCRYLPGAAAQGGWDFLTYFELAAEDIPAFRDLLIRLRDPQQNPEWAHVDREVEIWMTRTVDA